jgi:hypothetical protein
MPDVLITKQDDNWSSRLKLRAPAVAAWHTSTPVRPGWGSCRPIKGLCERNLVVGTLAAARKALRDARSSIGDMATAQNLEHYERYWKHFLDALKKVENKVRTQLKDVTGFRGWIGQWEGRRKADPLLAYCLHARNSDGHWIKEITAAEGRMTIKAGKEGSSHIRRILITPTKRQVQYTGGAPELKFVHRLRLLPVEDGGQPMIRHQRRRVSIQLHRMSLPNRRPA